MKGAKRRGAICEALIAEGGDAVRLVNYSRLRPPPTWTSVGLRLIQRTWVSAEGRRGQGGHPVVLPASSRQDGQWCPVSGPRTATPSRS